MKLMTKQVIDALPGLYSQENTKDPVCTLKFFTPDADWTWFVLEGEPVDFKCPVCGHEQERKGNGCEHCQNPNIEQQGDDWLFFGSVVNHYCPDGELGYTRLSQLQEVRGGLGLPVERDMHWRPQPLSQCIRG